MQIVAFHVADQLAYNKRHVALVRSDTAETVRNFVFGHNM
ncbi:Unknown protein sequence [Pseudomonas savastanoi pv. glycinea]|nr:Unknown protein sequence [Pseudomonas savastanoi pv. glycinea]